MLTDWHFRPLVDDLTPREREVADLIAQGYTNPEIARKLTITLNTAKTHTGNILSKLGVGSRAEVAAALRGNGAARPCSDRAATTGERAQNAPPPPIV